MAVEALANTNTHTHTHTHTHTPSKGIALTVLYIWLVGLLTLPRILRSGKKHVI